MLLQIRTNVLFFFLVLRPKSTSEEGKKAGREGEKRKWLYSANGMLSAL